MLVQKAATQPLAQRVMSRIKYALKSQYEPLLLNVPVILSNSEVNTYWLTGTQALPSLTERSIFSKDNWNLTNAQKELLLWHCRWSHCDLQRCRMILSKPQQPMDSSTSGEILPQMVKSIFDGVTTCPAFRCEACQFAKQRRRSPQTERISHRDDREGALSKDNIQPGDKVSCDHYMSTTRGRLPHTHGKESKEKKLVGGTIFVDHATNYIFSNHQNHLTAAATVDSKHQCEKHFGDYGITIKQCSADNHPFCSQLWKDDCIVQQQLETAHSGVGVHHQVKAERHMQTISNWSCALMLHFVLHWPQMASKSANLWPFAIDLAIHTWNRLPARNLHLSPLELLAGGAFGDYSHLQYSHVFGCPVYVLDPKMQDAKKIPKWKRRARRGVYLGISKEHSSTVHLVLNPETGAISPQYHCVFDDTFSTVFSDGQFEDDQWESLLQFGEEWHPSLDEDLLPPDITDFHPNNPTSPVSEGAQRTSPAPEGACRSPRRVTFGPNPTTPSATEGALPASEGATGPTTGPASRLRNPLRIDTGSPRSGPSLSTPTPGNNTPFSSPRSPVLPPQAMHDRPTRVTRPPGILDPSDHTVSSPIKLPCEDRRDSANTATKTELPTKIAKTYTAIEDLQVHSAATNPRGRDYFKTDLIIANYCGALNIERSHTPSTPSLGGSTQTSFAYNASNRAPRVPGERLHASFFANLNWTSLFDIRPGVTLEVLEHSRY